MNTKEITKKLDTGTATFTVDAWPSDVNEAVEMWGARFVFNAIDQQAMISARSVFVATANGTDNEPGIGLEAAAKDMADWKPPVNGRAKMSQVEKLIRDARKNGFSDTQIDAMLNAVSS